MAQLTLERTVRTELKSITDTIPLSDAALVMADLKNGSLDSVISWLAKTIQGVDGALERLMALKRLLDDAEKPDVGAEMLREIHEQRHLVQVEEEGYRALRSQLMQMMVKVNPEHEWFWTEEWQAGERQIDRDLAAGEISAPMTGDEFLAELLAATKYIGSHNNAFPVLAVFLDSDHCRWVRSANAVF